MSYSVLVTGGTGSLGLELLHLFLADPNCTRIRAFNRSERTQYLARQLFPTPHKIEWLLGDIRNLDSLRRAASGMSTVVHTAAMKQVHLAEENVWECMQTNVTGTQNIITACQQEGVTRLVSLSTDKAASPSSVYGYSKYLGERLMREGKTPSLSSVSLRFGNLLGSEGSVIDLFIRQALTKETLTVTDLSMTRFFVPIGEAAEVVYEAALSRDSGVLAYGGFRASLGDVVSAFKSAWEQLHGTMLAVTTIPVRAGERTHEEILSVEKERLCTAQWSSENRDRLVWHITDDKKELVPDPTFFTSQTGPFVASGWLAELLIPIISKKLSLAGAH